MTLFDRPGGVKRGPVTGQFQSRASTTSSRTTRITSGIQTSGRRPAREAAAAARIESLYRAAADGLFAAQREFIFVDSRALTEAKPRSDLTAIDQRAITAVFERESRVRGTAITVDVPRDPA